MPNRFANFDLRKIDIKLLMNTGLPLFRNKVSLKQINLVLLLNAKIICKHLFFKDTAPQLLHKSLYAY